MPFFHYTAQLLHEPFMEETLNEEHTTIEFPHKGHVGAEHFVHYRGIVLSSEISII